MKKEVFFVALPDNASAEDQCAAMKLLLEKTASFSAVAAGDLTGIKFHVGEKNNTTHIRPQVIKTVVDSVKSVGGVPFLTETSTLYRGERDNAVKHITLANDHGFGFEAMGAPFICADGLLGNSEAEVEINGIHNKTVRVAHDAVAADALVIVSHPTGHMMAGIGATIKNLGMGLASRQGKMRQHSNVKPVIEGKYCKKCGQCARWCPKNAITMKESGAEIVQDICIGCGECLAVCKFDAIKHSWDIDTDVMQEQMAEHAYGAVIGKTGKVFYINVLVNMTKECDCMGEVQHKCMRDVGIMASTDPVALDQATLDMTKKIGGVNLARLAHADLNENAQLVHAEKIGMGSREYTLVELKD